MIIKLKKEYACIYGTPKIRDVDDSIFKITYFANCMESTFCNDKCCSFGADIDFTNIKRLEKYADALEKLINIPMSDWFINKTIEDKEFPGDLYTRIRTQDGLCIFVNKSGRGCLIHKFCIENNIDYHELKPMVGCLFPITFDEGLIHPSNEVKDKSLLCLGGGTTNLYRGVRSDLLYYFGQDFINELDYLEIRSSLIL
ncbi:MAG: hypothetical protein HQK79_07355 [Desulfobacterales bacterium]|nr:hypothetical protein [Desulfobacterales bacterium]MBF0396412.1 hypothetical protein [Desulfobacterales bacterium]